MRLTWVSGTLAGISALVTAFNDQTLKIFGDDLSDGIKASVLIAIIAAWALIAVADLLARAIATPRLQSQVNAAPGGMKVTIPSLAADQEKNWLVAGIEASTGSDEPVRFLVVKTGQPPCWVELEEIQISAA